MTAFLTSGISPEPRENLQSDSRNLGKILRVISPPRTQNQGDMDGGPPGGGGVPTQD